MNPETAIPQCIEMLKYLNITHLTFKYYYGEGPFGGLPINPSDNRVHKTFTFNSDGTIDYAGYLSHSSDRWTAGADIEIKNLTPNTFILETIFKKLKNKSMDKARNAAMKQYMNRQLCLGGLGFLLK